MKLEQFLKEHVLPMDVERVTNTLQNPISTPIQIGDREARMYLEVIAATMPAYDFIIKWFNENATPQQLDFQKGKFTSVLTILSKQQLSDLYTAFFKEDIVALYNAAASPVHKYIGVEVSKGVNLIVKLTKYTQ